jgi:hypothetical protein
VLPIDLSRRVFLRRAGLAGMGAAVLLAGCGRGDEKATAEADTAAGTAARTPADTAGQAVAEPRPCDDLSGLSPEQIELRETFGYVEEAPDPEFECHHCEFYHEPAPGKYCGGCTLFAGPVNPEGFCDSFSAA